MKNYRYCLITAAVYCGVREHPQVQMKKLGAKIIKAEPIPVADCWIFGIAEEIENPPQYLTPLDDNIKFWSED